MKTNQGKKEASPATPQVNAEIKETKPVKFVVVREGYRVSDKEYVTAADPAACHERDFWSLVAERHSYGEPVAIVQYDSKRHRVW